MRASYNGITSDFQSDDGGSIPSARSNLDVVWYWIDYDEQFTKSFVEPLRFITEKILWKIDDSYGTQGTLEDFF